ncbi:MAG: hypothetical protein JNK05_39455 [Myxococcales bacterium]|nr:hypothetical protein [Myxococcales bacterium]
MDRNVNSPEFIARRPHMLLLTGDQIYADSVNPIVGSYAYRVARTLAGVEEAFFSPSEDEQLTSDSRTDARSRIAADYCSITAGTRSGHALRFTEYLLLHFLSWSPALWPNRPSSDLTQFLWSGAEMSDSERVEIRRALLFRDGLVHVRKLLANVATLMSFDDHEITDDWNMDKQWMDTSVFSRNPTIRECSRRYQSNGLLAFAVCQHWGNAPQVFANRAQGGALLSAAEQWARRGYPMIERSSWNQYIGQPDEVHYQRTGRLRPENVNALRWSYRVHDVTWNYDILSIDGRTRRTFGELIRVQVAASREIDLALLDPTVSESVLPAPTSPLEVSFIVVSQPVLNLPILQDIKLAALARPALVSLETVRDQDLSEGWDLDAIGTSRLLLFAATRQPRKATILVSGDVHYSYTGRVALQYFRQSNRTSRTAHPQRALIIQCVSSGARNEDSSTISLHNNRIPFTLWRMLQLNFLLGSERGVGPLPTQISRIVPQWTFGVESNSPESVWNSLYSSAVASNVASGTRVGRNILSEKTTDRPGIVLVEGTEWPSRLWGVHASQADWYWRSDLLRGRRADLRPTPVALQPGELIVGHNNVGLISFAENNGRRILRHELLFRPSNALGEFRTRFDVVLDPQDPAFPLSPLPISLI